MKTTDKNNVLQLYKFSGDFSRIELLRLSPKSGGFVAYLPHSVAEALNLRESDRSLLCFIDDSSSYTYLVIVKDNDLVQQLRPLILEKREKAEALHRKMREQIEAQKQQNVVEIDEVEK